MPSEKDFEIQAAYKKIHNLRKSLDKLDSDIVDILAKRFKITSEIGSIKAEYGFDSFDPARQAGQLERLCGKASSLGLDKGLIRDIFNNIFNNVINNHEKMKENR